MNLENNKELQLEDTENDTEVEAAFENSFAEIDKIKGSSSPQENQVDKAEHSISENLLEEEPLQESEDNNLEEKELQDQKDVKQKEKLPVWKLNKHHWQARAALEVENNNLQQEIENLKTMLSDSVNSGMYYASNSAQSELERAKEKQKIALDHGDRDAFVEANIEITKAINKLTELERWPYNNVKQPTSTANYSNQPDNYQNNSYSAPSMQEEMVYDWIDTHPYLQSNSSQYDPVLERKVADYIVKVDSYLEKTGRQNLRFSDEYFENIDKYISKAKAEPAKIARNIESVSQVGGVRSSYSSPGKTANPRSIVTLNAEEKLLAENMGVSEDAWIKEKIKHLKLRKGK